MQVNHERSANRAPRAPMGTSAHECRLYASETELIEALRGYVGGALWSGDSVVLIGSERRVRLLEDQMRQTGLDLAHFRSHDRFISLSAEATLAHLLVDGMPDAQ